MTLTMKPKSITNKALLMLLMGFLFAFPVQHSLSQGISAFAPPEPEAFIGLGVGINDYGVGLGAEIYLDKNLWIYGMGGYSTWGYRLTGGLTYYPGQNGFKSAISLGYSYASGAPDFIIEMDVDKRYSSQSVAEEEVRLNLFPLSTINLVYSYNARVGRKSKLVFNAGYSFLLTDPFYEYTTSDSYTDLTDGSKQFIGWMAPGGIIIGAKFMFGSF